MPTYEHACTNVNCNHSWEDYYSVSQEPPTECPECHQNTAKRVICGTTKGVVELTGDELVAKLKSEGKQLKRDAARSENLYSNLLSPDKYQSIQTKIDQQKRDRRR